MNILEIEDKDKIKQFFLQNKNYCSIDLPGYFDWQQILKQAEKKQIRQQRYKKGKTARNYKLFIIHK